MKIDNKILGIIIAIVIILLLLFLFTEEEAQVEQSQTEDVTAQGSSDSGTKPRLPQGWYYDEDVHWDECCKGFVTVTFNYDWNYFFGEEIDRCDDPVRIRVTDSEGIVRYSVLQYEPTTETVEFRGYWDCHHLWGVYVENDCVSSITFDWTMTMECD